MRFRNGEVVRTRPTFAVGSMVHDRWIGGFKRGTVERVEGVGRLTRYVVSTALGTFLRPAFGLNAGWLS